MARTKANRVGDGATGTAPAGDIEINPVGDGATADTSAGGAHPDPVEGDIRVNDVSSDDDEGDEYHDDGDDDDEEEDYAPDDDDDEQPKKRRKSAGGGVVKKPRASAASVATATTGAEGTPARKSSGKSRVLNCESCRTKKMKCDRKNPCSNCTIRGIQCEWSVPPPSTDIDPAKINENQSTIARLRNEVKLLQARLQMTDEELQAITAEADRIVQAERGSPMVTPRPRKPRLPKPAKIETPKVAENTAPAVPDLNSVVDPSLSQPQPPISRAPVPAPSGWEGHDELIDWTDEASHDKNAVVTAAAAAAAVQAFANSQSGGQPSTSAPQFAPVGFPTSSSREPVNALKRKHEEDGPVTNDQQAELDTQAILAALHSASAAASSK